MRRIEINSLTMVISDYEKYEEGLNPDEVTVSSIQSGFYLLEIEGYEGSRVGFIKE